MVSAVVAVIVILVIAAIAYALLSPPPSMMAVVAPSVHSSSGAVGYASGGCGSAMLSGCAPCPDPCTPPVHCETMSIPHHTYVEHRQPIVNRWLEHKVSYQTVPVTQASASVTHPTIDQCVKNQQCC